MSEEKENTLTQQEIREKLRQYVVVLIKYADWIPEAYRQFLEEAGTAELLNEIYLCACDGIRAEEVQKAKESRYPEASLRILRRSCITKDVISEGVAKELKEIRKCAERVEARQKKLEEGLAAGKAAQGEQKQQKQQQTQTEGTGMSPPDSRIVIVRDESPGRNPFRRRKRKSVAAFMEELLAEESYSKEQIHYLLDSIEEGASFETVQAIASPKLPVEVMRRLRNMEEKGEEKDGTGQRD